MTEWSFLCLFKLGIFLLDLLVKKLGFLVVQWGGFMVHVNISFTNSLRLPFIFLHSKLEFHLHFTSISIVTFQILVMFPFLRSIEVQWQGMGGHARLQSIKNYA
jgi:hypothetical protein